MELFCTREDLIPVFDAVEGSGDLVYAQTGLFAHEAPLAFASGRELPDLGVATRGQTAAEASYLVSPRETAIRVRAVPQRQGGVLYAVDQLVNPDTIVLEPAGLYRGECMIAGRLATVSSTPTALALYGLFSKTIRRSFTRVQSYWVGPEALRRWTAGMRLTPSVRASHLFDLKAPAGA